MATVVHIQARLGSTRLPGKVLYQLGSCRVLGWVIKRAQQAEAGEDMILAIGDRPENEAIIEWCNRNQVTYYTGSEEDLLNRHLRAARKTNSDPVVRITGDCPFVPPSEIDRVVEEHKQNNARYTTNVADEMPIGTAVDVLDRDVLTELHELGDTHPVRRLRNSPDEWKTKFYPGDLWTEFSKAHTAVDTPDDYWTLIDAVTAVGDDPKDVTRWIANRE